MPYLKIGCWLILHCVIVWRSTNTPAINLFFPMKWKKNWNKNKNTIWRMSKWETIVNYRDQKSLFFVSPVHKCENYRYGCQNPLFFLVRLLFLFLVICVAARSEMPALGTNDNTAALILTFVVFVVSNVNFNVCFFSQLFDKKNDLTLKFYAHSQKTNAFLQIDWIEIFAQIFKRIQWEKLN